MAELDFSTLSPEAKKELARYLTLNERARKENALGYWEPWECKHDGKHASQADPFKSTARRRLVMGGNRSGKSEFGAADTAHMFLGTHPFRRNIVPGIFKVIGEDYPNHLVPVILPKLLKFIPKSAIKKMTKNSQGYVTAIHGWNGSQIQFMCYEQKDSKFESFDADGVWYDEPPPKEVHQAVARGLVDRAGYELFTMTPIKEPWIYNDLWLPALEGTLTSTDHFSLMSECNPHLSQSALEELKEIYDEEIQEARLRGNFLHLSGLVYKMFRKETHVIKFFDWPKNWPVYMCIDPHPKKPHAVTWMGVTNKDQKVILDELKAACDIKELAIKILSLESQRNYHVVDRLVDTSIKALDRQDQLKLLHDYGIRCRFAKKHDDVDPGIQRVQQALTPIKTNNDMIYIDLVVRDNCVGHIKEFMSYVWDDSATNRPKKELDDFMDNVRYITGVHPRYKFRQQPIKAYQGVATYVGHRTSKPETKREDSGTVARDQEANRKRNLQFEFGRNEANRSRTKQLSKLRGNY